MMTTLKHFLVPSAIYVNISTDMKVNRKKEIFKKIMRMSRIIRQIFLQNLNDSQKGRYNRQKIIKIFLKGVRNFFSPVHTGANPLENEFLKSGFLTYVNPNSLIKINLDEFQLSDTFLLVKLQF